MRTWLVVLGAGCQPAEPTPTAETGDYEDDWTPGPGSDEDDEDTGDEVTPPTLCPSADFPGEPIGARAGCPGGRAFPAWELQVSWAVDLGAEVYVPAVVGRLTDDDGNGVVDAQDGPDVVTLTAWGVMYAHEGRDGSEHWTRELGGGAAMMPAIGDLHGDGFPDVVAERDGSLGAYDGESGSTAWTGPPLDVVGVGCGAAGIADLDGDGDWEVIWSGPERLEILAGQNGHTLAEFAYDSTSPLCAGPVAVADVDGDGHADIVVAEASGTLRVLTDAIGFTGDARTWPQSDFSLANLAEDGSVPRSPEPNWMGANNFRAGPPTGGGEDLFPVLRDVCSDECARGTAWAWYAVGNGGGTTFAGTVDLEFWGITDDGETFLASASWTDELEGGMISASSYLELDDFRAPLHDLEVRIVRVGVEGFEDCDLADDLAPWGHEVCP